MVQAYLLYFFENYGLSMSFLTHEAPDSWALGSGLFFPFTRLTGYHRTQLGGQQRGSLLGATCKPGSPELPLRNVWKLWERTDLMFENLRMKLYVIIHVPFEENNQNNKRCYVSSQAFQSKLAVRGFYQLPFFFLSSKLSWWSREGGIIF